MASQQFKLSNDRNGSKCDLAGSPRDFCSYIRCRHRRVFREVAEGPSAKSDQNYRRFANSLFLAKADGYNRSLLRAFGPFVT